MKKKIAIILSVTLAAAMTAALAGCAGASKSSSESSKAASESTAESSSSAASSSEVVVEEETGDEQTVGGWTVNTDYSEAEIPDDAKEAFEKASENYVGTDLTPIAYLGSQVVAGTNYAFLCTSTPVTQNPKTNLVVAIVYEDLDGNCEMTTVNDFDISKYAGVDSEADTEQLEGGFEVYAPEKAAVLPDDVQTAFDAAMEGLTGVSYTPMAYLGSQVVAGSNYAILCSASTVTAEPVNYLAVVTVYAGVDGTNEIVSIANVNIADFNV